MKVVRTTCTVYKRVVSSLMLDAACTDLILADYAEKRNGLALLQVDSKARERGLRNVGSLVLM